MAIWAPSLASLSSAIARRAGVLRALERDDRLGRGVVGSREVDGLGARGRDRELVDVDVERLLAGLDRLVEAGLDPRDVALGEAELVGNRVGHGGLEALAVGRVVVAEPRVVRRIVGRDRERAGLDQRQVGRLAVGEGRDWLLGAPSEPSESAGAHADVRTRAAAAMAVRPPLGVNFMRRSVEVRRSSSRQISRLGHVLLVAFLLASSAFSGFSRGAAAGRSPRCAACTPGSRGVRPCAARARVCPSRRPAGRPSAPSRRSSGHRASARPR